MAQFRTKARAVELLGKGQIADLPTAISELWKNGYDAYGDNLEGVLYQIGYKDSTEPYFVISDDGKGMNRDDVLDKWFVLGTDSKTRDTPDRKGEETLNKPPRIKMGEKGIGRLAVAYLGPQMAMFTKRKNFPLQIIFFDWRILENYELFLQNINIPLRSVNSLRSVGKAFEELTTEFLLNFQEEKKEDDPWREQKELKRKIIKDCENLVLPEFLIEEVVSDLFATEDSHGTKFLIFQPDRQIIELTSFNKTDEAEVRDETSANYTISTLVGLFNLFKTENPAYKTKLWIVDSFGKYDLLTLRAFFDQNDFKDCDHLIEGDFDQYGEFQGIVRIYNKQVKHKFFPIRTKNETAYGPFSIRLGYVQPEEDKSLVKGDRKRMFEEKLELYSGLFVYRDGFRVLPYGRPDADFLEFEERRSKSVGAYFFSKRRMFGYIEISRLTNKSLKDKSSREGFINNEAYRTFKVDLIAFFKDLAKKYFGTDAEFDYKEKQQEDLSKVADAEKAKDQELKKEFTKNLREYPKLLAQVSADYSNLIENLNRKTKANDIEYEEMQGILNDIHECKVRYQNLSLRRPARINPTDTQKRNLHSYSREYQKIGAMISDSQALLEKALKKLKVQQLFKEFESRNKSFTNSIGDLFSEFEDKLKQVSRNFTTQLNTERDRFVDQFKAQIADITPSKENPEEIIQALTLLESVFTDQREKIINRITPYLKHLEGVSVDIDEDSLVGYYKTKFEEIQEEWSKTYELAQLGIAVEIIDHQFNTLYAKVSQNVKDLKKYLTSEKKSEILYNQLANAFHHLEDNYKLLQPLYRTTGRVRTTVEGAELYEYVNTFFETKLEENNIRFEITDAGKRWNELTYESIFKPVLINIINNAIFWLQPVKKRTIRIDSIDGKLLIMNSGVKIEDYSLDQIFKLFYSERAKGRGIGLYLAKKSLNGIGYEIYASNDKQYNLLDGACFIIEKAQTP